MENNKGKKLKKVIFIGNIASGKTTLSQAILGEKIEYKKTQAVEVLGASILDTPGEYLELGNYRGALMIVAAEAEIIAFVQAATDDQKMFSPCYASCFPKTVIGVVTKIDKATDDQVKAAEMVLKMAGAEKIFKVSNYTKEGIKELKKYLEE